MNKLPNANDAANDAADDALDFGPLPDDINTLLQAGVAAHFDAPAKAELYFREAVARAPDAMPAHRCLFKHYNRKGQLDQAHATVLHWLAQAARKTGLPADWRDWRPDHATAASIDPRPALPALKALAFIQLRRDEQDEAETALARLELLDPDDGVGWSVVASLLPEREAA